MRLVVDTNILLTYFWEQSVVRELLMKRCLELFSPEYALEEINRHKSEILKKTGLTSEKFDELRIELAIAVEFVSLDEYKDFLKDALASCPDSKDVDFIALSMKLNLPLWSNDKLLESQHKVVVVSTSRLLKSPEFLEDCTE